MASTKISAMAAADLPLVGTELAVIVQGGTNKKVTVEAITAIGNAVGSSVIPDGVLYVDSLGKLAQSDWTIAATGPVAPKTSGDGIKLDTTTPAFGYHDILGQIELRGVGANDPNFAVYTGTSMRAYQFSASTMNEFFMVYHLPHDYAPGTDIFFHMHWSNAAATPNTGNVVWAFEYTFAKGYNQEAFPATATIKVTQASPATRYQHNIAETAAVTIASLEPDGLILCRCYRDATNVADTCTDAVFAHTADVHYQSTGIPTKGKNFPFYT